MTASIPILTEALASIPLETNSFNNPGKGPCTKLDIGEDSRQGLLLPNL